MSKIPPTKNAQPPKPPTLPTPQQIQIADAATIGLWVIQINDYCRAIGDIASRLFNEIDKRQAFINSLPKPADPPKPT